MVWIHGGGDRFGAHHASELAYVFGTLDASPDTPWTAAAATSSPSRGALSSSVAAAILTQACSGRRLCGA